MVDLRDLTEAFTAAKAAWDSTVNATDYDDPKLWDAYEAAEHAVIIHPCKSLDDVRLKARFFLDHDGPNDTLRNCMSQEGPTLDYFLRSLLGEEGAA